MISRLPAVVVIKIIVVRIVIFLHAGAQGRVKIGTRLDHQGVAAARGGVGEDLAHHKLNVARLEILCAQPNLEQAPLLPFVDLVKACPTIRRQVGRDFSISEPDVDRHVSVVILDREPRLVRTCAKTHKHQTRCTTPTHDMPRIRGRIRLSTETGRARFERVAAPAALPSLLAGAHDHTSLLKRLPEEARRIEHRAMPLRVVHAQPPQSIDARCEVRRIEVMRTG